MKRFLKWLFLDDSYDWQHDIALGILGGAMIFSAVLTIMGFFALIFWVLDQVAL